MDETLKIIIFLNKTICTRLLLKFRANAPWQSDVLHQDDFLPPKHSVNKKKLTREPNLQSAAHDMMITVKAHCTLY